jgi:hypothetical protein
MLRLFGSETMHRETTYYGKCLSTEYWATTASTDSGS